MFKSFECDSITVPSCDKHNTHKSGNDQAIVSALLQPLHTGKNRYPLEPEVEQAIRNAFPSFERAKRKAIRTSWLKDPPSGLEDLPDISYLDPSIDIKNWVRQLTAGLIYDGIGEGSSTIAWSKSFVWSPDWFSASTPAPIEVEDAIRMVTYNKGIQSVLDNLKWKDGWSAYPRPYPKIIYSFSIHIDRKDVFVRHKFYNRFNWYVQFKSSSRNIAKLIIKIDSI